MGFKSVHTEAPGRLTIPSAHRTQDVELPPKEYVLAAQSTQPVLDKYFPAAQSVGAALVHTDAPAVDVVPVLHFSHETEPTEAEKVPT